MAHAQLQREQRGQHPLSHVGAGDTSLRKRTYCVRLHTITCIDPNTEDCQQQYKINNCGFQDEATLLQYT